MPAAAQDSPARRRTRPTPIKRLRMTAHALGVRSALKGSARRLGFDLVNRHFYSPVPDLENIPDAYWSRRSALAGLDWDADRQLAYVEEDLAAHVREFTPSRSAPPGAPAFYLDNGTYGAVDAELLYAMVRHHKPRRVLEVGSGFSSLVIGQAMAANAAEGDQGRFEIVDPWPGSASYEMGGAPALRRVAELRQVSILDVPLDDLAALEAGDILFVDTTHTVKVGGDVNRLVLDVLPLLAPGVVVHFHDVFLPFEYPRDWVVEQEWYWAEQYLLQAFLAFNGAFEILVAAHHLAREHPDRLAASIPTAPGSFPLALWLRRTS